MRLTRQKLAPKQTGEELVKKQTETFKAALAAFSQTHQIAEERGARAFFVYLPILEEVHLRETDRVREALKLHFTEKNLTLIDLTEKFRKLSFEEAKQMFLKREDFLDALDPASAARHYSVQGNRFVASLIHQEIVRTVAKEL